MEALLLKKLVSVFVHLIPGVPLLLLCFLLLRRKLPRISFFCSVLCTSILIAASIPAVSNFVVSRLENQYPVMQSLPSDTGLILVLGSGHTYKPERPINSILYPVALARLTEGVRLWKTNPSVMMAVSGYSPVPGKPGHAAMMEEMALEWGVPQDKVIRFDESYDTEDEIVAAIEIMSQDANTGLRLVVVSSAIHLPRAAMLLKPFDIETTLAPTEFIASEGALHMPSAYALLSTDRVFHEWVGMLWYEIRNRIKQTR